MKSKVKSRSRPKKSRRGNKAPSVIKEEEKEEEEEDVEEEEGEGEEMNVGSSSSAPSSVRAHASQQLMNILWFPQRFHINADDVRDANDAMVLSRIRQ